MTPKTLLQVARPFAHNGRRPSIEFEIPKRRRETIAENENTILHAHVGLVCSVGMSITYTTTPPVLQKKRERVHNMRSQITRSRP